VLLELAQVLPQLRLGPARDPPQVPAPEAVRGQHLAVGLLFAKLPDLAQQRPTLWR
jgi:hypothetical protein